MTTYNKAWEDGYGYAMQEVKNKAALANAPSPKYVVLTNGEPCWHDYDQAGNQCQVCFDSYAEALAELMDHINTLNEQGMDYDATEFTIEEVNA